MAGLLGGCFAEPEELASEPETPGTTTGDNIESSFTGTPTSAGSAGGTSEGSSSTGEPDDDDDGAGATSTTGIAPGSESGDTSSGGDGSTSTGEIELDCAGVPNGDAAIDECGVCNGPGGPCWGCTIPSASNYDPLAEINDGTCSCTPAGGGVTDQSNLFSDAGSGGQDQWQSFTTGIAGALARVDLGVGSPIAGPSAGTIRIYEGEGTGGTELGSIDVTFEDVHNQMQEFALEDPIPLSAGTTYTIRFSVPAVTVGWVDVAPDVYEGGRASYGAGTDFVFRTVMTQCVPR
ncbi:MAG: hypothetical protein NXI35_08895 [bacterium]|nr:hypothetical protein [bacterium]